METDELNLMIIESLMEDGRRSIRKVAEDIEVSPSTVSSRMDDLIQEGVIKHFKPVLDYEKLGFDLTAITKIQARGSELADIVGRLREEKRLTHVYEITGEFDILVIGKFNSREDMNREIKKILHLQAVQRADTSIVLNAVKEDTHIDLH